jgi:hypothetical protein
LDPSLTYNILITCSSDNLPDATHELQIIVQTPPGYNVIPFSQLVISGGIFEGLQRDGDYIAPPGASLIFPEEEHVYAIYKNALDVSKYSSDMQLQNISYIDFDNIVDVGDYAFNGLTGLTGELKISDNISHIGVNAFANTSYTTNNISGLSYSYTDDVHHNQ